MENMDNSRVSISIYWTGSEEGGYSGQICFIIDKKKRHLAYTDNYLRRPGAAYVSTIDMTENGYMVLEAWE